MDPQLRSVTNRNSSVVAKWKLIISLLASHHFRMFSHKNLFPQLIHFQPVFIVLLNVYQEICVCVWSEYVLNVWNYD